MCAGLYTYYAPIRPKAALDAKKRKQSRTGSQAGFQVGNDGASDRSRTDDLLITSEQIIYLELPELAYFWRIFVPVETSFRKQLTADASSRK